VIQLEFPCRRSQAKRNPALSENGIETVGAGRSSDEIDIYQSNIKIVSALAEKYGFKYIFYWQPTIFQKRSLTAYEQKELELRSDAMPFYQRAYGFMREKTPAIQAAYNFINLGEMFSDTKEPMYIDYCHLGEVGNGRVTEKMFQDVYPLIKSMSLPDTGGEAVSTGR